MAQKAIVQSTRQLEKYVQEIKDVLHVISDAAIDYNDGREKTKAAKEKANQCKSKLAEVVPKYYHEAIEVCKKDVKEADRYLREQLGVHTKAVRYKPDEYKLKAKQKAVHARELNTESDQVMSAGHHLNTQSEQEPIEQQTPDDPDERGEIYEIALADARVKDIDLYDTPALRRLLREALIENERLNAIVKSLERYKNNQTKTKREKINDSGVVKDAQEAIGGLLK